MITQSEYENNQTHNLSNLHIAPAPMLKQAK